MQADRGRTGLQLRSLIRISGFGRRSIAGWLSGSGDSKAVWGWEHGESSRLSWDG